MDIFLHEPFNRISSKWAELHMHNHACMTSKYLKGASINHVGMEGGGFCQLAIFFCISHIYKDGPQRRRGSKMSKNMSTRFKDDPYRWINLS